MALLHISIRSKILALQTSLSAVIPETACKWPEGEWPVLWLLHGLTNDHTSWQRSTRIEQLAEERHIAVIMPEMGKSFCVDMAHGERYGTYLAGELPQMARRMFRITDRPEHTFIGGISMGGYGAVRTAMDHPDRYGAVFSLSGALDAADLAHRDVPTGEEYVYTNVFGPVDRIAGSRHDLIGRLGQGASLPRMLVTCGTGDDLLEENRRFARAAEHAGYAVEYDEVSGGHTWDCWDRQLPAVFDWLFGSGKQAGAGDPRRNGKA